MKNFPALPALATAILLSACGGGDGSGTASPASSNGQAQLATGSTTLMINMANLPQADAMQIAQPFFHAAPALLDAPDDSDVFNPDTSATSAAHQHAISQDLSGLSTQRLTAQDMRNPAIARARRSARIEADGSAAPMAASTVIATYTPAQIRAAYGLPAVGTAQAAQLGAGQTIYLIDAQHDPNAAAELAAFNAKFGLPACTTKSIAATASLPLPSASGTACEFSVVFSTAGATMSANAPAYDANWATEITLDVQWAHATAPLARIVLIEAPDASLNSLLGAVKLANTMGPGIVSMSFGSPEGNWTASVDSAFTGAGMTYLAATGDSGAAVSWPSVSSNVVAVGGTTLSFTGTGSRSEVAWSGTGGGISSYTPTPSYQNNTVPGINTLAHRAVADVSFNADPASGQYVAVQTPGTTTVSWLSVGGTSLSTPQWAGLMAVANAARAQTGKPALGAANTLLYGQIATVPGSYASVFADVTRGSDGTCTQCAAKAGYDTLTGLGTPNVAGLINALTTAGAATAPVVTPAAISATAGTPLTFTAAVLASNPVSYTLSNAPSAMSISSTGVVSWPAPVLGTYAVTVTAKDSKTALSGQGVYTVTVTPPTPPVVAAASASGVVGTPFSFATAVTASDPVTLSLSGAPAGMVISTSGVLSWASPVAGNYSVTVTAKDAKTGLTGTGVYTIRITSAGPVITAAAMAGVAGKPLSSSIGISDAAATFLSVTISGVPLGMGFSINANTLIANWASPVVGNYSLKVVATDNAGLSATLTIPVTITAK